ncbi:hypothetical protein CNECB9_3940041 [Cupriavidus necator]|uniref:Uncharacterized protein n=1 Tax=Cupriavidus necator TaxID=106590 RepID=A0A1K0JEN2_CUPNE|nr:hypothetical protein CNECB9_3940041 [Cupriavidus necator]
MSPLLLADCQESGHVTGQRSRTRHRYRGELADLFGIAATEPVKGRAADYAIELLHMPGSTSLSPFCNNISDLRWPAILPPPYFRKESTS